MSDTNPIAHIRTKIFGCPTQEAFAKLIGMQQSTVSRWENGMEPDRASLARIREVAIDRGVQWNDRWFFEVPQENAA